jgi:hypothetical protein
MAFSGTKMENLDLENLRMFVHSKSDTRKERQTPAI